jgi:hypothetical protein
MCCAVVWLVAVLGVSEKAVSMRMRGLQFKLALTLHCAATPHSALLRGVAAGALCLFVLGCFKLRYSSLQTTPWGVLLMISRP